MKATWNDTIIAESDDTVVVDNNHYFPRSSMKASHFKDSDTKTRCPWKGEASYYTLLVDGEENKDAAWHYPTPKKGAMQLKDRVAFWRGVKVSD